VRGEGDRADEERPGGRDGRVRARSTQDCAADPAVELEGLIRGIRRRRLRLTPQTGTAERPLEIARAQPSRADSGAAGLRARKALAE